MPTERERWEWCDADSPGRDGGRFRPRTDRRRRLSRRSRDQPDLTVVLVGDRERIEAELAKAPDAPRDRLPIVHASQVIGMDEKPVEALRKKRDNSISRCWGLMAAGEVKAVVSAGQHRRDGRLGAVQRQDVPARASAGRGSPRSSRRTRGRSSSSTSAPT